MPAPATIRYLSTLNFPTDWLESLRELSPRLVVEQIPAVSPGDVPDEVWASVDVLHTSTVFPDPAVAARLRWIQLDTSGVDHVRSEPVWHSSLDITTIGGISPLPLAEYVACMILAFAHRLPAMRAVSRTRQWPTPAERWHSFMPASVRGATVGVIGYGRIGREIGRLATALGMTVLGVSRTGAREHVGADFFAGTTAPGPDETPVELHPGARLHDVLAASDYVVVVVPLTEATGNLMDAAAIAAIKPGAVVINVSRGGIVDECALAAAVRSGAVSGAALDVFADEPLPPDSPWWSEPAVVVTPHISGLAPDYYPQVQRLVIENLRRFLAGEPLLNRADRVHGY